MAWAAPARRSGFLLLGLVLLHLVVISGQVDGGQGVSLLERAILATLSPPQALVDGTLRGVGQAWHGYVDLRGVREENQRLQEKVDVLEQHLQEKQDQVREAERLRVLLGMRAKLPYASVAADVISRQGSPWFRSLMVNRGLRSNVRLNAAVVTPAGVVGRVVAVGPNAARVQILLDRDCSVGALISRSSATGVVSGQVGLGDQGTNDLLMKYVGALADVLVGDEVVTSGLDGIYPKGLIVGHVRSVAARSGLFKDVVVEPSAMFDRIEEVLIVERGDEDRSLTAAVR